MISEFQLENKHALGDHEFNSKIERMSMRLLFVKYCVIELSMLLYFIQIFVSLVLISEKDYLFEIKDTQISIPLLLFVDYKWCILFRVKYSPFQKP